MIRTTIKIAIIINIRFEGFSKKLDTENPLGSIPLSGDLGAPARSLIVNSAVAECVLPPPDPSTVTVYVDVGVDSRVSIVNVD